MRTESMCKAIAAGILVTLFARPTDAQVIHPPGLLPSFEVATIKPAHEGGRPFGFTPPPPNIFRNINSTARDLVRIAYGLAPGPATRVLGGPSWIDSNHYDVDAKIADNLFAEMRKMPPQQRRDQMFMMVQSVLADRFKLKVHFETREMPVYELVVAKGGPRLAPAKEPPPESDKPPMAFPRRPEDMRQGILVSRKTSAIMEMTAKGQTMDEFAQLRLLGLNSPVINKTGLTDRYDFILDWTPEQPMMPATSGSETQAESGAPPLYTAVQEQLGLKLIPTKGSMEVIVIDRIEMPSQN